MVSKQDGNTTCPWNLNWDGIIISEMGSWSDHGGLEIVHLASLYWVSWAYCQIYQNIFYAWGVKSFISIVFVWFEILILS